MTRKLLTLLLCAALFPAAQYQIKLNPGDSVLVEAVTVTAPPVTPPVIPPVTPAATIPLGINLPGPDEWGTGARAKMFVDLRTTAREIRANVFRVLTSDDNDVYEAGVYKGKFGSKSAKITGTYLLSWTGAATVTASGATIKNIDIFKNTADVVVASDTVNVDLIFSAPITNFSLLRPGYPRGTTQTITNEFKAFAAPFSTLRFMNLQETNWAFGDEPLYATDTIGGIKKYIADRTKGFTGPSVTGKAPVRVADGSVVDAVLTFPLMNWADRPKDSGAYHRQAGISYEAIVRTVNETSKEGWICLQPNFSDDLAAGLANYIKVNSPGTKWKIEFGNENPWNDISTFGQAKAIMAQADAAKAADPFLNNPSENPWYIGARFVLKRTKEASDIFRSVFGQAEFDKRFTFILSGQNRNASYMGNALNWGLRKYGNLDGIHGIAFAPYIGASQGTPDQILATLDADIATRYANTSTLMIWRGVADAYQKKLFVYEGGVDESQGTANLTNRIASTYDPRMKGTLRAYLDSCYSIGIDSLMYFQGIGGRTQWGPAWPLTDDALDFTQPMYQAAVELTQQPAITGGLTATFYKDTNFTTALGTITIPCFNHRWEAWSTGPIWGRKDLSTTQAADGSIRVTGRYLGTGTLTVEKEANDVATLTTKADGTFQCDYKAIFGGNGIAWVRLMANGKPVRAGMFSVN